jgi:hypothetical protein
MFQKSLIISLFGFVYSFSNIILFRDQKYKKRRKFAHHTYIYNGKLKYTTISVRNTNIWGNLSIQVSIKGS